MLSKLNKFISGLVRPVVTFGMCAAFVVGAFIHPDAAQTLAGPAGILIGYWFKERSDRNSSSG